MVCNNSQNLFSNNIQATKDQLDNSYSIGVADGIEFCLSRLEQLFNTTSQRNDLEDLVLKELKTFIIRYCLIFENADGEEFIQEFAQWKTKQPDENSEVCHKD